MPTNTYFTSAKRALLGCLLFVIANIVSSTSMGAVPRLDPDYSTTVDRWWAAHRFNPESSSYNPTITSPTPVVNLSSGQSIQTAINGLPSTGGTIKLAAGTYGRFDISGRSNVHIISDGGAIITGASVIAVSTRAHNYGEFDRYTSRYERRAEYWNDLLNPTKNFYFKNLIFDGQNSTTISVTLKRVYDVVFDNCVFRNLRDPASGHPGPVAGHMGLNNIWYRNCHFVGNSRFATYLDGAHGCGAINCTVEGPNFGSGGFLYLTNDDFTEDINGNGRIDRQEERNAKYIVIYNCLFNGGIYSGLQTTGENILFMKNRFTGGIRYAVGVDSRAASAFPELQYKFTNLFVIGNTVPQNTFALLNLNNMGVSAPNIDPIMGQYRIAGNRVSGSSQLVYVQTGPIIGPNEICGNCVNDSSCVPNLRCYTGAPGNTGDVQSPTAPSSLRTTSISSSSVSLAWNASTDNVGVSRYRIYRNGVQIASVTGTNFQNTGLAPSTTYSYVVRAVDSAGNLSQASNQLSITTLASTGTDTQAPTAPTNLRATSVSATSVSLAWNASTDNVGIRRYRIYLGSNTNHYTSTTNLNISIGNLKPSTSYTFRVRAVDTSNNLSPYSSSLTVRTLSSTPSSSLVYDSFTGSNGVNLNGRTTDSGHRWSVEGGSYVLQNNRAINTSQPAYALVRNIGVSESMVVESKITLPATAPTSGDWFHGVLACADVQGGRVYDGVQARFLWQGGSSEIEIWEWAEGTTYFGIPGLGMAFVNLTFHQADFRPGQTYTLRLIVNGRSAVAYIVGQEERTTVICPLARLHQSPNAGLNVDPQGSLKSGGFDDFRVSRLTDTQDPTAPSNLRMTSRSGSTVTLAWNPSSDNVGVRGYVVQRNQSNFQNPNVMNGQTSATAWGLQPNTTYRFWVTAYDAAGNLSPRSTAITVTTAP
jgi:chitodextrinase